MPKTKGFRLGRKLMTVFKWAPMRKRKQGLLNPLEASSSSHRKCNQAMQKIQDWSYSLKQGVKKLCCGIPTSGYERLGPKPSAAKPVTTAVPKGYLAVYVGEKDGFLHRFLVPVVYFNHPLFVNLLKEAEQEYGFDHPGGITIPCHLSDFEKVRTMIAAGGGYRKQALKCH